MADTIIPAVVPVTFVKGVYKDSFVQPQVSPASNTQHGNPILPPVYSPAGLNYSGTPTSAPLTAEFTPAALPNLALWLDANVGITLNGSNVSGWADQSGVSVTHNLTQATAAKQPAYNAVDAAYNGFATLSFTSAAGSFMQSGVWADPPNQPMTIFLVGNNDAGNNQTFYDDLGLNRQTLGTSLAQYVARAGVVLGAGVGTPALTANPIILGAIFDGVTSSLFVNSATAVANGDAGAQNGTGTTIGVGGDTATNPLNGKIASIIAVHGVMSAANIAATVNYLQTRYL